MSTNFCCIEGGYTQLFECRNSSNLMKDSKTKVEVISNENRLQVGAFQ